MADSERVEHDADQRARRMRKAQASLQEPAADAFARGYRGNSAPPMHAPRWQRRLFVDRQSDLTALVRDLSHAHVMAIDAEFAQPRVRAPDEPSHRLALLQIAIDNDYRVSYIVDALRLADLSVLREALEDGAILKLFHGIGSDAKVLATRGLVATHTIDLEAVSRSIFGQRESGLQAMLHRAYDIRLDKSLQRADWSRRPLTTAMVAYAARDAEMTLALYGWLKEHYPWAVALHQVPAQEVAPEIAPWILPYLDGARPRPAALAIAEAGLANDRQRQAEAIRQALAVVRRPNQLARVIRLGVDLELAELTPDLRSLLGSPAADVRAGAARALGRLRDSGAEPLLRPLLEDSVQDVREAAQSALHYLAGPRPAPRVIRSHSRANGAVRWTSSAPEAQSSPDDWRSALRSRFGVTPPAKGDESLE